MEINNRAECITDGFKSNHRMREFNKINTKELISNFHDITEPDKFVILIDNIFEISLAQINCNVLCNDSPKWIDNQLFALHVDKPVVEFKPEIRVNKPHKKSFCTIKISICDNDTYFSHSTCVIANDHDNNREMEMSQSHDITYLRDRLRGDPLACNTATSMLCIDIEYKDTILYYKTDDRSFSIIGKHNSNILTEFNKQLYTRCNCEQKNLYQRIEHDPELSLDETKEFIAHLDNITHENYRIKFCYKP